VLLETAAVPKLVWVTGMRPTFSLKLFSEEGLIKTSQVKNPKPKQRPNQIPNFMGVFFLYILLLSAGSFFFERFKIFYLLLAQFSLVCL
jgi:hypothetical protein